MSETGSGAPAPFLEGWHHDPFGRHESRFHDGRRWTPYVKDGETHALDEPVDEVEVDTPQPGILAEPLLVVELPGEEGQSGDGRVYSVFGQDGRDLGAVRPAAGEEGRWEVVDGDGLVALTLTKASAIRRSVVVVRDGHGVDMGRVVEQHLPGPATFALESSAGGNVGFVRARTWAGWDVRVEDERSRTLARVSQLWDGVDRATYASSTGNAAVLGVEPLLKRDTRGFQ